MYVLASFFLPSHLSLQHVSLSRCVYHIQLQDDIESLRKQLHDKEVELADVKTQLGITPYTEFKQSVSHGWEVLGTKWKGMQETET